MTKLAVIPVLMFFICTVIGMPYTYISHCKYNLYKLDCANSSLLRVPSCIQLERNIVQVFLCHKIVQIDLSNNHISALEVKTLDPYQGVVYLNLEYNDLYYIDENAFQNLDSLQVLQLSHNRLSSTTFHSANLIHLEIRECLIRNLDLQYLPNLQSVNLDNNQIQDLKIGVFHTNQYLRSIILSHNIIETIEPGTFWPLKNLTYLDLSFNQIKSLPHNLFGVEDRWLSVDLSYNSLERIDLESSIGSLNLSNNRIQFLEPDLSRRLLSLEVLDLSSNMIQSIPNIISGSLSQLFLRNNSIIHLGSDTLVVSSKYLILKSFS